jgi:hypothetical protein
MSNQKYLLASALVVVISAGTTRDSAQESSDKLEEITVTAEQRTRCAKDVASFRT